MVRALKTIACVLVILAYACGGQQHSPSYAGSAAEEAAVESGSDFQSDAVQMDVSPDYSDYEKLRGADDELRTLLLSSDSSIDCKQVGELSEAICDLSKRVCKNVATRGDNERCDDSRARCERSKTSAHDICPTD